MEKKKTEERIGRGIFDGMLICSDFDETLYSHGVAPANTDAIRYFMDNGGLFTLCTGRDGRVLDAGNLPVTPNTFGACMNGAMIYDFITKTIVEKYPLGEDYPAILQELIGAMPLRSADIVSENLRIGFSADSETEFQEALARIDSPVYKLVVYKAEPSRDWIPEPARRLCAGRYNVLSNSKNCFEITAEGINKAFGVKKMMELTGARTLITVGDCDGDISMFRLADIRFSVANAIPELKALSDYVTRADVREGAFPEIVSILENTAREKAARGSN